MFDWFLIQKKKKKKQQTKNLLHTERVHVVCVCVRSRWGRELGVCHHSSSMDSHVSDQLAITVIIQ